MPDWRSLRDSLGKAGLAVPGATEPRAVGGGDISAAWCVETDAGRIFLKTGGVDAREMFAAEADGLTELKASDALRVPEVLAQGTTAVDSFLALEWIDLAPPNATTDWLLGQKLARQHRLLARAHGWHRDNTIGLTPQVNARTDNWTEFYRQHRLRYQLELAARNGYRGTLQTLGALLLKRLPAIFGDHDPAPSLLHGDLWGGNHASSDGQPVIFDPAVYYGDRETDLAMTRLFGGFSRSFYDAYDKAWPLPVGHQKRLGIYQLYHVLNHLNLFGRAYLGRSEALIKDAINL